MFAIGPIVRPTVLFICCAISGRMLLHPLVRFHRRRFPPPFSPRIIEHSCKCVCVSFDLFVRTVRESDGGFHELELQATWGSVLWGCAVILIHKGMMSGFVSRVHPCVRLCVDASVGMCVCVSGRMCPCVRLCVHAHACLCFCVSVHVCMCICLGTWVCVYVRVHVGGAFSISERERKSRPSGLCFAEICGRQDGQSETVSLGMWIPAVTATRHWKVLVRGVTATLWEPCVCTVFPDAP